MKVEKPKKRVLKTKTLFGFPLSICDFEHFGRSFVTTFRCLMTHPGLPKMFEIAKTHWILFSTTKPQLNR